MDKLSWSASGYNVAPISSYPPLCFIRVLFCDTYAPVKESYSVLLKPHFVINQLERHQEALCYLFEMNNDDRARNHLLTECCFFIHNPIIERIVSSQ